MFINNILSNVYVYQSWENFDTMSVSSRTGVIFVIHKKVIKKILQITDPSQSFLDEIIFLFLNISYITIHNRHFYNLKTNQLLSNENHITHTFYYT